jgi:hypothetical protein
MKSLCLWVEIHSKAIVFNSLNSFNSFNSKTNES